MRRPTVPALVVIVALLLLADFLVVNAALGELAAVVVDAAILVAAGAALAAGGSLAWRRGTDLWRRRGDPVGAVLVLIGIAVMLAAGLRPGAAGDTDPAVQWLVRALLLPIAATLFGLLFVTTLAAARRSVAFGSRESVVLVGAALAVVVLLLPLGGPVGAWLSAASTWTLELPIGAVFRGLLLGIAILTAVFAVRTMFGIEVADE